MSRNVQGLLFLLVAAGAVWAQTQSPQLPDGLMVKKIQTTCTECHDSSIIIQQRLDKKLWTKEVDKMTKWGALVDPADRDGFIEYLSTHFGPDNSFVPRQNPPAEQIKPGSREKKSGISGAGGRL
jgi:hypothetical protein